MAVLSWRYRASHAAEAFQSDGWFETGDLGFLLNGELYVTGRVKESIVINGANYHCGEIEELVEQIEVAAPSYTAACAVRDDGDDAEKLAIFFHSPNHEGRDLLELVAAIRSRVASRIGVQPTYVVPVGKRAIQKTAVGKLLRTELKARFEAGQFKRDAQRPGSLGGQRKHAARRVLPLALAPQARDRSTRRRTGRLRAGGSWTSWGWAT